MKRKREEIFRAIEHERTYQDRKWGPLEKQNNRDVERWLSAVREELAEAEEAYDISDDPARAFALEMVQVAAVAIAALEQLSPDEMDESVRKHRKIGALAALHGVPMPPEKEVP
jgi:hypothetical protein